MAARRAIKPKLEGQISRLSGACISSYGLFSAQLRALIATESILGHSERVASLISTVTPVAAQLLPCCSSLVLSGAVQLTGAASETTDWWGVRRDLECGQWLLPERFGVVGVSPQPSNYATQAVSEPVYVVGFSVPLNLSAEFTRIGLTSATTAT